MPWQDAGPGGITPLESNAIGLRYAELRPRPFRKQTASEASDKTVDRAPEAPSSPGRPGPPSLTERNLRQQLASIVAAQAVEDEAELRAPRGGNLVHRYNAVLKRVLGKGRSQMTLPELEAALSWLDRHRLGDHIYLLDGDARYAWSQRRRMMTALLEPDLRACGGGVTTRAR